MIKIDKATEMINNKIGVDITAPLYWWENFDTYNVGTVIEQYDIVHNILTKEYELDDFSHERLTTANVRLLKDIIYILNFWRSKLVGDDLPNMLLDMTENDIRYQIVQLLPSSYNQKRTIILTTKDLEDIYEDRNNYKLDEWKTLCGWIEQNRPSFLSKRFNFPNEI